MTRADWLADVGMDAPVTIPQWEAYLKAIKDKENVKIPLSLGGSSDANSDGLEELWMGAYGILSRFYTDPASGKVAYGPMQSGFKDYLTLMNRWYGLGLISQDFPSIKASQHLNMFTSGNTGVIAGPVAANFALCKPLGITVVTTQYPRLTADSQLHDGIYYDPAGDATSLTAISAKSPYIKEAMRWLDYAYTDTGSTLFNYGVEGKSWEPDANGVPQLTDYILKNPKYPPEATNYILKVHFGPKLAQSDMVCNPSVLSNPEGSQLRWLYADDPNVDNSAQLGAYRMTNDEASERATIMTSIDSYVSEMSLKFIMNVEPLDNFDSYVAQLKSMGIDRAIEITQTAKDRMS